MPTTRELDDDDVPSRCVYAAVSTADGRPPLDLPPLGWSVDPAALDSLLAGEGTREVTFEYCGFVVTASPGAVRVESLDSEQTGGGSEQSGGDSDQPGSGDQQVEADDQQVEADGQQAGDDGQQAGDDGQ